MSSGSRRSRPAVSENRLTLATFLPYRLNVLAAVVSDGLARTYAERFGIGIAEWRVLATVGEFKSITGKAIGLHAHMSKVKVSRAGAMLEGRGLIRRVPNPNDRREAFLVLTGDGDRMYSEITPVALAYVASLQDGILPQEATLFDAVVTKLLQRAHDLAGA